MRKIENQKKLNFWLEKYDIPGFFSCPNHSFELYQLEKKEYLNNELDPMDCILFVVSGSINILHVREDGSIFQIASVSGLICLGDTEFASGKPSPYLVEAAGRITCIALPLKKTRKELEEDPVFLSFIASELAKKIEAMTAFLAVPNSLPERVLYYLEKESPDHELHGIEKTACALSCSKRQLIRILNKLMEEDKIIRIGRGRYRLNTR